MKIAIGNDHVAYELKLLIKSHLEALGHEVLDFGSHDTSRADYPVYGRAVARAVQGGEAERGIVLCGTGVGISLAANKLRGIRCVVCSEPYSALLSRRHNDTNMLALGARVVGTDLALMITDSWLGGVFEGGRHAARVDMIREIESTELGQPPGSAK